MYWLLSLIVHLFCIQQFGKKDGSIKNYLSRNNLMNYWFTDNSEIFEIVPQTIDFPLRKEIYSSSIFFFSVSLYLFFFLDRLNNFVEENNLYNSISFNMAKIFVDKLLYFSLKLTVSKLCNRHRWLQQILAVLTRPSWYSCSQSLETGLIWWRLFQK